MLKKKITLRLNLIVFLFLTYDLWYGRDWCCWSNEMNTSYSIENAKFLVNMVEGKELPTQQWVNLWVVIKVKGRKYCYLLFDKRFFGLKNFLH